MKTKYFSSGYVFEASLCRRLSLFGEIFSRLVILLKDGLIWSIGDVKEVKILSDKWLPN